MKIKIKKIFPDVKNPSYSHRGDAGLDIYAYEDLTIKSRSRGIVSTGLSIEIPIGYAGLIWEKSGLAAKSGIKTMAGVIDSNYRGELKVVLLNTSEEDYIVRKGEKICQLLIQKIEEAEIEVVEKLSETSRGDGRFGSSGLE